MTTARWAVDREALERASIEIKLKWPIKVYRTHARGHYGRYKCYVNHANQKFHHNISVDKLATAAYASKILWHELWHAYEAEQLAKGMTTFQFMKAYDPMLKAQYDQFGEWYSPSEIRARSWEKRAKAFPLTRRAK